MIQKEIWREKKKTDKEQYLIYLSSLPKEHCEFKIAPVILIFRVFLIVIKM